MTAAASPRAGEFAGIPDVPRARAGEARGVRAAGRARAAWNLAAVTAIWGTSLVIVALWVSGSGIQALAAGGAPALDALGRITGLVSANLLLYQVLLMAGVPLFERGFGRDGMTRFHRLAGFWSFWLLVAHLVLITAGYALAARVNPLVQFWEFVWDFPGMLLATAGTILLVLVVVTSARRTRRRMRYESWHLLHLYGYLGAGLAVPHMLWTGADFDSTAATVYWWALWAAAAAAVIVFRVARPLWRSARHDVRVVGVDPDGRAGVVVRMRGRRIRRLRAQPGQYFVWRFRAGPGWTRGHPFSLAHAPSGDDLSIAARRVGDGTARLAGLRPGTRVLVEGPFGHLTGEARTQPRIAMFGAGSGVSPLVALLESEPYAPGGALLVTREHAEGDLLRSAEIGRLITERGIVHRTLDGPRRIGEPAWMPATHHAWTGPRLVRYLLPDPTEWDVYLAGPAAWVQALRADLRAAGVPHEHIHAEAFSV